MSVKIIDHTQTVMAQKKLAANRFLHTVVNEIEKVAEPKTPKQSGDLREVKKNVVGLKATLKWDRPYAQYQERGRRANGTRIVRNYSTPGTGPKFAENAVKEVVSKTDQMVRATGGL